nr:uncharacterized protein LOC123766360 [Procambarus clarkii]
MLNVSVIFDLPCAAPTSATSKNALRERTRVESLRRAYLELQAALPSVPPNTKLSKLDVLVLATTYISHLSQLLEADDSQSCHDTNNNTTVTKAAVQEHNPYPPPLPSTNTVETGTHRVKQGFLHPIKKWPMRARLYAGVGATEAVTFLSEQLPTPPQQLRTKLGPTAVPAHAPCPHQLPPQASLTLNHTHATSTPHETQNSLQDFGSSSMAPGVFNDEFACPADKSYGFPYMCEAGGHSQGPREIPYAGPQIGTWEAEGSWGSNVIHDDPAACHPPCRVSQSYAGFWTAWDG